MIFKNFHTVIENPSDFHIFFKGVRKVLYPKIFQNVSRKKTKRKKNFYNQVALDLVVAINILLFETFIGWSVTCFRIQCVNLPR